MTGRRSALVTAGVGGLLAGMIGVSNKVVLHTYSAALGSVAVEQAIAIQRPNGAEAWPIAGEQARGSGRHREAVLVFSSSPQEFDAKKRDLS